MVQVRVQTKGMDLNKIAKELEQDVQDLKEQTLTSMAETIAQASPVDSGYYARNHEVGLRSGSFQASSVRPSNAPRRSKGDAVDVQSARSTGLQNMLEDIANIDLTSENFVFRNPMVYSNFVETEHAVYARARRDVSRILAEAVANIRARNR